MKIVANNSEYSLVNNSDDIMKEYLKNNHELFRVKLITKLRDGGTIFIQTTKNDFYADKDTKNLHNDYPLTIENQVKDQSVINYLFNRIDSYLNHCKEDLNRNTIIYNELLINN
jgi:hypothetical protein